MTDKHTRLWSQGVRSFDVIEDTFQRGDDLTSGTVVSECLVNFSTGGSHVELRELSMVVTNFWSVLFFLHRGEVGC
ncbi:hypothetical protein D3C71_1585810 [compost metagenome]